MMKVKRMRLKMKDGLLDYAKFKKNKKPCSEITLKNLSLLSRLIGKHKGIKTRVRYPSMTGGYTTCTFSSMAEAQRHIDDLIGWQKRRAKMKKVI